MSGAFDETLPAGAAAVRPRPFAAWSAAAPVLCAIHCIATPLVVAVAPNLALGEPFERGLKAGSAVLAVAVLRGGVRVHRRWQVLVPVLAGFLLWLLSGLAGGGEAREVLLSALGGLLVAAGMLWNGRLRHIAVCRSCSCAACEEGAGDAGERVAARTTR
jgi:hypothetical protein